MQSVFDYNDYRVYLNTALPVKGEARGTRTRLASLLKCRLAFVSNVLNGLQHFSLEHGVLIAEFLGHSEAEQGYFLLLLQKGRAGSRKLEDFFESQLKRIREEREQVRNRIQSQSKLSESDRSQYYGSWIPVALHVMAAVPELRSARALRERLRLSESELREPLEFLLQTGILKEERGSVERGPTRIHLDSDSPHIRKHHANWRGRALEAIDREPLKKNRNSRGLTPLHYSLVMSLAGKDLLEVRKVLMDAIERTDRILKPSPEETGACLNIDLFEI